MARASISSGVDLTGDIVSPGAYVATDLVKTSTSPARLHITIDWPADDGSGGATLVADGIDTALIRVEVQDVHQVRVPSASNTVSFNVVGAGAVIGVGNGDPSSHERDKGSSRRAFSGMVRAVVQTVPRNPAAISDAYATKLVVMATSPGLTSDSITIGVLPPPPAASESPAGGRMKNDETWPVSIPEQHGDDEFLRSAAESTPAMQIAAVQALTGRILGGAQSVDKFTFEILSKAVPGDAGKTCFELAPPTAAGGVAVIRGSTGVELAAGLGHYLRHVANVSFSVCSHYRPSSTMIVTLITSGLFSP